MEDKVKVWLARDWNGALCVHCTEPFKNCRDWISYNHGNLEDHYFPSIKWEDDEPTEAYITLAEPQEQPTPKQEIDWEQRRYEIAKEMMPVLYRQGIEILKFGQKVEWDEIVNGAVNFADILIEKLKKGGER